MTAPGAGSASALVVDDDPFVGQVVASQLASLGLRATVVTSAEAALALLADLGDAARPRFALIDRHLGDGMAGDELPGALQAHHRQVRCILMSGEDPITETPVAFLQKPFSMKALSEALGMERQP